MVAGGWWTCVVTRGSKHIARAFAATAATATNNSVRRGNRIDIEHQAAGSTAAGVTTVARSCPLLAALSLASEQLDAGSVAAGDNVT